MHAVEKTSTGHLGKAMDQNDSCAIEGMYVKMRQSIYSNSAAHRSIYIKYMLDSDHGPVPDRGPIPRSRADFQIVGRSDQRIPRSWADSQIEGRFDLLIPRSWADSQIVGRLYV